MPHVAGHTEEEEPLIFDLSDEGIRGTEEPLVFDFGVGQGRTEQKFVPENNSSVNMPATSTPSFDSRESKEFIEGQEGFFGNTSIQPLLESLGAPGGIFELDDIKKLPGGVLEALGTAVTGGLRERVILGAEKELPSAAAAAEISDFAIDAVTDLARGEFKSGTSKLFEGFGRARQTAPPGTGVLGPFGAVMDLAIQKNPELAERFNSKMLQLQAANEDFLIRNDLMFGPDDEPTIVGNLLSQVGLTGTAIGAAIALKSPVVPALIFGTSQQVSGFQAAEEAGKDPFTAATIGTTQGIIEGGLTFFEIAKLTSIIASKSASISSKIIAGMIAEGIEEGTTEALIAGVQNLTGVEDMTLEQALLTVFQAVFYGSIAGGGVTGTISTVQRVLGGDTISQEDIETVAGVVQGVATDEAVEITEQAIDDADTELQIARDAGSDQPVTKAAKVTKKQQEAVVKLMQDVNEGKDIDIRAVIDKTFPEIKVQREKQRLEAGRRAETRATTKQAIRDEVVELQAQVQIAEQQGNEEEAARLSERIDTIQQLSFTDTTIREAVEELEAEGIFVRRDEQLERAIASVENVLRQLRVGVDVGRELQREETLALQQSLTNIVKDLGKKDPETGESIITAKQQLTLQQKVDKANTVKSAEKIRRDIIDLARKFAFQEFKTRRQDAIDKLITANTGKKPAELAPGYQNTLDALKKMRRGMEKTGGDDNAVVAFNTDQGQRLASDMDHGIPPEDVMLQVRYLDILNLRARVTPEVLARFEDDLNAFIVSGKGLATSAQADQQAKIDQTKAQMLSNKIKTPLAELRNSFLVDANEGLGFFSTTYDTLVVALGAEGTVYDLHDNDVKYKSSLNARTAELLELADSVSEGEGKSYLRDISHTFFKENVIDVPREGLAKSLGGIQSKDIKMTRGKLIYSWMILQEPTIRKQLMNPKGEMAWTPELVAMIEDRISPQDQQFALGMFALYEKSYAEFNANYRKANNRDLPKIERYSHLRRKGEEGLPASVHNETMFADLLVGNVENPSALVFGEPAEAKTRQQNAVSEIKIDDVLSSFARYTYDTEHYNAYNESLTLIRKIQTDKEFIRHMQGILGTAGYRTFEGHLRSFSRLNNSAKGYFKLLEKFRQFQFKSTLLANPKIGIGQLSSITAWAANMPKASFVSGLSSYGSNPDAANKVLNDHPTFKNRELNFDSDIEQLNIGPTDSIFKALSLPIRKGDAFAVRAGAWARYRWLVDEKGVRPDKALKQVARFAERSQQSVLASQRTLAQKSTNPVVRSLTMYRSSLTAMFNVSMQSIIQYRQADKSTPQKKAEARNMLRQTLAIQNLVIPATFAFLTGGNVTRNMLVGSLAGIAGIGELVEVIAGIVLNIFNEEDDKIYIGGTLTLPAVEAFEEFQRAQADIGKFTEKVLDEGFDRALEDGDIGAFFGGVLDIVDKFTPFPITNTLNIGEGLSEAVGLSGDDPVEGTFKALGFKTDARERMLKRIEAVTGERQPATITPAGAF